MEVEVNSSDHISDGRTFYFIKNLKIFKKYVIIYIEKEKKKIEERFVL